MSDMKLLLKIRYIGTNFCGFQCQKNGRSVQEILTEAAAKVFGTPCNVTGCSRTDAGVHALGYVCAVSPVQGQADWCTVPVGRVHRAFAPHLPEDISVIAAAAAPDPFHPRYDAVEKEYVYRIWDGPYEDPFEKKRCCRSIRPLADAQIAQMNAAAAAFVGTHDFRSFAAGDLSEKNTVRTVTRAAVAREGAHTVTFTVAGNGFLYNMVRIMTGTLLETASGKIDPAAIPAILAAGDRSRAGFTAPPDGLYLKTVKYAAEPRWECE